MFDSLSKDLSIKFDYIPSLPGKAFWKKFSPGFLTNRLEGINNFLDNILSRQELVKSEELRDFLQIDENIPELKISKPAKLSEIFIGLSCKDLVINKNQLIVGACNQGLINNIRKQIVNIGLGQSEHPISHALFMQTHEDANIYSELWRIPSTLEIECICWNRQLTILAFGTYEGFVHVFLVRTELGCTQYEDFCALHLHGGKIIGISINYKSSHMYTCGEDKRLVVSQLNGDTESKDIMIPNKPVSLKTDFNKEKLYIGTNKGDVHVFDISQFQPVPFKIVDVAVLSSLSILCIGDHSLIIVGSETGDINIHQQGEGEKSSLHRLLISLKAKYSIKSIVYSKSKRELIAGTSEGFIYI